MTDYRQAHNLATLFIHDDITGYRIQGDGLHVGYHDAKHRRNAAAFVQADGWTLNELNAVVSQTATVNGITVDLYSKADGVDWKRHHDAVNRRGVPSGGAA